MAVIGSADVIPCCQSAATVIFFLFFGIQVLLQIKCAEVDKARSLSITPGGQTVKPYGDTYFLQTSPTFLPC